VNARPARLLEANLYADDRQALQSQRMKPRHAAALALVALLCGCSPELEAYRPDPVDLRQFKVGQKREQIVKQMNPYLSPPTPPGDSQPDTFTGLLMPDETNFLQRSDDSSCDTYTIYTHGPGPIGRAFIAFGEGMADVIALGLAEIFFYPKEIYAANDYHFVTFCYGSDHTLATIQDQDINENFSWFADLISPLL
jgi:hypothetical protein